MMRPLFLFFVLLGFELYSQAPKLEHEVGVTAGAANYYGDINTQFGLSGLGPSGGVFWRGVYGHRFALRTSLNQMHISASDANSSSDFQKQRNLSFKSDVTEFNTQIEFNFLKYVKNVYYNEQGSRFTTYVSLGGSVFLFNPQAEYNGKTYDLQSLATEGQSDESYTNIGRYNLYSLALTYGGGIKYHLHKNLSLGLDFSIRRTFTDYLDDVSGQYVPVISLPDADKGIAYHLYDRSKELGAPIGLVGKQRGSMNGGDDFATLMFSMSWTFMQSICPSERF